MVSGSFVANVTTDGSSLPTVTIYHGGTGFVISDTITIPGSINWEGNRFSINMLLH
jgi:hypothetical protein